MGQDSHYGPPGMYPSLPPSSPPHPLLNCRWATLILRRRRSILHRLQYMCTLRHLRCIRRCRPRRIHIHPPSKCILRHHHSLIHIHRRSSHRVMATLKALTWFRHQLLTLRRMACRAPSKRHHRGRRKLRKGEMGSGVDSVLGCAAAAAWIYAVE
ncbi:uncharacterized protein LOC104444596 [Eucalyptus grandis]|uniref:uncharacterized protein LOC104444596 n=1 Tax=Eucalyptus grandis TaxID=71139 RepID=UPI00192EFE54|nr:uncharacterized protein LOC104444596 [Eucalyptus grandis]